jgi:hypothetical protein
LIEKFTHGSLFFSDSHLYMAVEENRVLTHGHINPAAVFAAAEPVEM